MKGILLVNTGSPKNKNRKDVREFIEAMLSDPLLMTVPDWLRPILVKGIIGPLRQFKSARHYSLIWDNEHQSSPLIYHMQNLQLKLEKMTGQPVEIAMRYLQPDIPSAFEKLLIKNPRLHEVIVIPLFPQYAESSYQTVVDAVGKNYFAKHYPFRLRFIEPYFDNTDYIKSIAKSMSPFLANEYDMVLFDFHSLPLSHVEKGWKKGKEFDYVFQAKEIVRLVSKELNLDVNKVRTVFSSAIGKKWLKPDLDETVAQLARDGYKRLLTITPGFATDNLETLFDITINARKIFLKHGGMDLVFVPCLNSEDYWVEAIQNIIN